MAAEPVDFEQKRDGPGDLRGRRWKRHQDHASRQLRIVGGDPVERGALAIGLDAH
jgi:hypothetical protein